MKLSIIIVNYNVQYFLEQALRSTITACDFLKQKGHNSEIFVVDNNSVDGSVALVKKNFPQVNLIENRENLGFSSANNQAIKASNGDYVLLLNPDTVVEQDTFYECVHFMDENEDSGALGVKMLDGKGNFLPESKRGFPSPEVAFYKAFGLAALFPKSRVFGKYHLGYIDEDEVAKVDVLAGAFMMLRRSVLNEIGLLDESFFMYGEDIDLSYRIRKAGYENYYFPKTRVIHYKGESTKKNSINYVFVFYNAMIIFARKHFSQKKAGFFELLLKLSIYLRASLALFKRFVKRILLPLSEFVLIYVGMSLLADYYATEIKFSQAHTGFPETLKKIYSRELHDVQL